MSLNLGISTALLGLERRWRLRNLARARGHVQMKEPQQPPLLGHLFLLHRKVRGRSRDAQREMTRVASEPALLLLL
jgi:hypothetical protein